MGGAAATLFLFAFAIRVRGIESHFWLLGDQIFAWEIALRRGEPTFSVRRNASKR